MPPKPRHSGTLTFGHPHRPLQHLSTVRIYHESTRRKQNNGRKVCTVASHIRTAAQSTAHPMQYVKPKASNHLNISGDDGVDSNEPKYNKTSHQCISNWLGSRELGTFSLHFPSIYYYFLFTFDAELFTQHIWKWQGGWFDDWWGKTVTKETTVYITYKCNIVVKNGAVENTVLSVGEWARGRFIHYICKASCT